MIYSQSCVKRAAISALKDAAEHILNESNKEVPIDEGTLKNSGNTRIDTSSLEASINYDTPYAVRQHEDLTLKHKNGKKAKFLENAIKDNMSDIERYLAEALDKALR